MPPNTMSVRYRPTFSPTGWYAENSESTSPQNPASPGSPIDAIAVNANTNPRYGTFRSMPPPRSAIWRVWYRS